jgi:hypothetical protein
MSWGIVAGAAATVGSALIGKKGQKKAAETAAQSQKEASELIYDQFQETKQALDPYSSGGIPAFERQQALSGSLGPEAQEEAYSEYVESPGVAFARERGLRGIERGAAAGQYGGDIFSGNVEKAKTEFATNIALQDFHNYYNRLGSVTGTGLAATKAIGGVGSEASQGQAEYIAGAGLERGAGQLQQAQTYQSAFQNIGDIAGKYFEQRKQNQAQGGSSGVGGYYGQSGGRGW